MNDRIRSVFVAVTVVVVFLAALPLAAAGPDADRYIVSFLNSTQGKAALRAAGARIELDLPNHDAAAAHIPSRSLNGLRKNPNIEYIEADAVRSPMAQTTPWGIPAVQADLVSDVNAGNTTVCIIDSGYSNSHEDLPVLTPADVTADSGTGDPLAPASICHHGTHVAGTIAALTNSTGVVGVLPNSKIGLHIVKVFEDSGDPTDPCTWGYSSTLVAALDACRAAGANVINMSLGGFVKNRTEQRAFNAANNAGVLSIAAAGNAGNTRKSYPASYDAVVSVAAVDSAMVVADFSQQNGQVELSGPGVAVRSTVTMGTGTEESLDVGGSAVEATGMEGSPDGSSSGSLFRCNAVDGLGSPGDCSGAANSVCLISRGDITFAEKAKECEAQGGIGTVIFNNTPALFSGTLGGTLITYPAVGVSGDDGAVLVGMTGQNSTVTTTSGNYSFFDGTSMATPHVVGVAALVWSQDATCTNEEIRDALTSTAADLGPAGRDNAYGFGLVQAADAAAALLCGSGGGGGGGTGCTLLPINASCSTDSECCSGKCKGKPGNKTCK